MYMPKPNKLDVARMMMNSSSPEKTSATLQRHISGKASSRKVDVIAGEGEVGLARGSIRTMQMMLTRPENPCMLVGKTCARTPSVSKYKMFEHFSFHPYLDMF